MLRTVRLSCCGGDDLGGGGSDPSKPLPQWSYSGATGPEHWGDLDPRFAAAKTGRRQSPIELAGPFEPGADWVSYVYSPAPLNVTNNGHSIQIDVPEGSLITLGGRRYDLVQYHFHTPSEHTVDGGFYEMELHLVHQDASGRFAVVGVFLTTGEPNPMLGEIWAHMPARVGESKRSDRLIDPSEFLPGSRRFVQYDGSLTTPPCTEGVAWIMMLNPISVSSEQVDRFEQVIGPNNRPVMPVNERSIRIY